MFRNEGRPAAFVHPVSTLTSTHSKLESILTRYDGLLVAFSGGVDSGVLLAVAAGLPGDRVVALTTDPASMPRAELLEATTFARELGVRHIVAASDELERPEYARN